MLDSFSAFCIALLQVEFVFVPVTQKNVQPLATFSKTRDLVNPELTKRQH